VSACGVCSAAIMASVADDILLPTAPAGAHLAKGATQQ